MKGRQGHNNNRDSLDRYIGQIKKEGRKGHNSRDSLDRYIGQIEKEGCKGH